MPEKTYILNIAHSDSSEIEEQEHSTLAGAQEAFDLLSDPDNADIYESITLIEYDWKSRIETALSTRKF